MDERQSIISTVLLLLPLFLPLGQQRDLEQSAGRAGNLFPNGHHERRFEQGVDELPIAPLVQSLHPAVPLVRFLQDGHQRRRRSRPSHSHFCCRRRCTVVIIIVVGIVVFIVFGTRVVVVVFLFFVVSSNHHQDFGTDQRVGHNGRYKFRNQSQHKGLRHRELVLLLLCISSIVLSLAATAALGGHQLGFQHVENRVMNAGIAAQQ